MRSIDNIYMYCSNVIAGREVLFCLLGDLLFERARKQRDCPVFVVAGKCHYLEYLVRADCRYMSMELYLASDGNGGLVQTRFSFYPIRAAGDIL
jgi:hypothetical protein